MESEREWLWVPPAAREEVKAFAAATTITKRPRIVAVAALNGGGRASWRGRKMPLNGSSTTNNARLPFGQRFHRRAKSYSIRPQLLPDLSSAVLQREACWNFR